MYIPTTSINMKDAKTPRIFLGLVGEAASGKTTAAATFPNPFFADFNSSLTQFTGKDIAHAPFWNDDYCVKVLKMVQNPQSKLINKRDGFKRWLSNEAIQFSNDQTLVLDSWTDLQNAFDRQTEAEPAYTKGGQIDEFAFWARKIEYSRDVMEMLKGLSCNVVVVFHELKIRDERSGELMDKIAPLMQGKFIQQIPNFFSDFFRAVCITTLDAKGKPNVIEGVTLSKTEYFWQIKANAFFNAKTRMSARKETFVPANFSSFTYI